ncbi:hypothetical protein HanRHA438_Chr17g0805641 [Helianthus annuus]|nr:hypothetical protein HanRHA438_Chr17g0805641 [Helianthus annuus]
MVGPGSSRRGLVGRWGEGGGAWGSCTARGGRNRVSLSFDSYLVVVRVGVLGQPTYLVQVH